MLAPQHLAAADKPCVLQSIVKGASSAAGKEQPDKAASMQRHQRWVQHQLSQLDASLAGSLQPAVQGMFKQAAGSRPLVAKYDSARDVHRDMALI